MIRQLIAAGTMALAAATGQCVVDEGPPEPQPCTIALVGDSLTVQARFGADVGVPDPGQLQVTAGLGWRVEHVQQWVTDQVAAGLVDVLVVALGTNDTSPTWGGGWTAADVARFRTLINTPHLDAWVLLVLPGHGAGIDPRHATTMDRARADLTALAATRPPDARHRPVAAPRGHPARPDQLRRDPPPGPERRPDRRRRRAPGRPRGPRRTPAHLLGRPPTLRVAR